MRTVITFRLSRDEIERMLAEHMSAQYGGIAEQVEVWPARGNYGSETFANVTVRNPKILPEKYFSQENEIPQQPI